MENKLYQESKTNFSANGQSFSIDVREMNTALITFTGTYNFTAVFEASDDNGTTWFPISAAMVNTATTATSHATTNATQGYEMSCHVFTTLRIRLTAFTSAGTHRVSMLASSVAVEPSPVTTVANFPASQAIATPAGTAYSLVTTASTNGALILTGGRNLFEVSVSNPTATPAYIKFYNKATAPTVGTDVPVITIPVAATAAGVGTETINFGQIGKRFPLGLGIAVTAAAAATDTAVAVAGVQVHGTYI